MTLPPVVSALRKHKAGVFLIGLQIALTLAIVCNVFFIVGQKIERIHRPTGLVENGLFMVTQTYVGAPAGKSQAAIEKLDSMQLTDLAALRALPDVEYATPINTLPLLRDVDMTHVSLQPGQGHTKTRANLFTGDQDLLPTFGLKLIAGRNFDRTDVHARAVGEKPEPPVIIVSRALADKLFPHGNAVGQPIYLNGNTAPSIIVGVVARILTANADNDDAIAYDAVLLPLRTDDASTMYAVRAKPGRMQQAMQEVRTALFKADPMRVIPPGGRYEPEGLRTFAQVRAWGYALDDFMVQVLTTICVILLVITCVGMTGLTSFWVNQRHKQIGIRRALGATKANILHYFQCENLLIAGGGCVAGIVLAIGINLMLLRMFQMDRMPVWYVIVGVIVILLLGQVAVFAPARRASNVPPVVATRSV
ncbi:MAG: ABC transporter, permease protein [Rhodanobacteraceae bacterium]|jgi:putative ABC transport system permease protein|nr:MAG: ABC transporter, permease protein [Rhodanobacteraceae bacterium]